MGLWHLGVLNFNCAIVHYTNELLILTSLLIADRLITKSCLDCSDNRKFVITAWQLRELKGKPIFCCREISHNNNQNVGYGV